MVQNIREVSKLIPICLLIVSVSIFFSQVICSAKPLFGSDFVLYFHPVKKFIRDYVMTHTTIPLWNPHQFSGTPLIANIQAAMFYPLGFLFYVMPTEYAYGYTIILHCILGAIFMYAFARSLTINKAGAFLAAIVFTFNGFFIAHLYAGHLTFVQSYIWIPLIFFFLHKFLNTPLLRHAVLAGLFLGLQILGGFPQIAFYTTIAIILFGAYHIGIKLRHGKRSSFLRLSGGMATIVLFGFALAAVQLLPTYEFAGLSTRSGGATYAFATTDSFDPLNFITFLMPNLFGNPANNTYWKSGECWQFWELCGYVGMVPLLLLCFLRKAHQTHRASIFFVSLLILSLFLSLGRYNPLYRFIYHLPGFHHFRIPAQILYLYTFSMSILAGIGLNGVTQCESSSRPYKIIVGIGLLSFGLLMIMFFLWPAHFFYYIFKIVRPSGLTPDLMPRLHETVRLSILTGAGLFALVAALIHLRCTHRLGPTSFTVALLLVTTVDLWSFSTPMVKTSKSSLSQEKLDLLNGLNSDPDICRVVTMGNLFRPNDGFLYGYQDIQGYDPLILKRYLEYINESQNMHIGPEAVNLNYVTRLDNHLIRMLNVKYCIPEDKRILKLDHYLPRVFIVHKALTVPPEKVLDFMMTHDFNPEEVVVFEEGEQVEQPENPGRMAIGKDLNRRGEDGGLESRLERCRIVSYSENEMELKATMNEAGYLVFSEINYPGWKAYVNGKEVRILTGNYIFRTLPLPKGNHDIIMKFESHSFRMGLIISAGSFLFLFLCQFSVLVRKKI